MIRFGSKFDHVKDRFLEFSKMIVFFTYISLKKLNMIQTLDLRKRPQLILSS